MTLSYREIENGDLIEIELDGKVERADFEHVAGRLERAIEQHGKLRLLEVVRSFTGVDAATLLDDLKFSFRHLNDFSRVAVVTDLTWMRALASVSGALIRAEIRVFGLAEIDAARAWLRDEPGPA
ncbi:MAG: STAS/SEC14 domain-containing protein [Geminicoccaceae bacterium]|nr:STAS/SEC14 domain-containing protein [Geminicoccaceae bacterium]